MIVTPQLIEVKKDWPEYGIRACQWEDYPTLDVFKDTLSDRFDRKYRFRMINGETLERWQSLLETRFDEVAPFFDRAIRMYTATDDGQDLIDGIRRVRERHEAEDRERALDGTETQTGETSGTTGSTSSETMPGRTLSGTTSDDRTESVTTSEDVAEGGTEGVAKSTQSSTAAGGTDTVTATIAHFEKTTETTPTGTETLTTHQTGRTSDTPDTLLASTLPDYAQDASETDGTQVRSFTTRKDTVVETVDHTAPDSTATAYGKTESGSGSEVDTTTFGKTVGKDGTESRTVEDDGTYSETETYSGPRSASESGTHAGTSSTDKVRNEDVEEHVTRDITEQDLFNYLEAVNANLDGWKNLFKEFVDSFERCFICVWW